MCPCDRGNSKAFDLHPLALKYVLRNHQWTRIKHYHETLFIMLKPARYVESAQTIAFGEIQVLTGPHFIITVRHGEATELGNILQLAQRESDWLPRDSSQRSA